MRSPSLKKNVEFFSLKRRNLFMKTSKRFFKSPRPSADRAELPCTLFPGCLSDAPEATAQSGCNDRTIQLNRTHDQAATTA